MTTGAAQPPLSTPGADQLGRTHRRRTGQPSSPAASHPTRSGGDTTSHQRRLLRGLPCPHRQQRRRADRSRPGPTDRRRLGSDLPGAEPRPGPVSTATEPRQPLNRRANLRRPLPRPPERTPQRGLQSPGDFHRSDGGHLVEQGRIRHHRFSSSQPERTSRSRHTHPGQDEVSARSPRSHRDRRF